MEHNGISVLSPGKLVWRFLSAQLRRKWNYLYKKIQVSLLPLLLFFFFCKLSSLRRIFSSQIWSLSCFCGSLAYLHECIEPKVVHRDIKSSNILIDDDFNAKVSDFGLAKLLGAGKSHITTRVMGTFGYISPSMFANQKLSQQQHSLW